MRSVQRCVLALVGAVASAQPAARAQDLYKSQTGPYTVRTIDEDWSDPARKRDVPVRIYLPRAKEGEPAEKHPVIVFSHGLGASRAAYGYFGEHLASHGYIVITPTHAGSDTAAIRGNDGEGRRPIERLRELADKSGADKDKAHDDVPDPADPDPGQPEGKDGDGGVRGRFIAALDNPDNLENRPRDVSFVIDQLSVNERLKKYADTSRIGVAGHSFGAYTAMAIGGMLVDLPKARDCSFRDPRVKAVLPMSPEGPGTMGIDKGAWDKFDAPVLFLTGTKDYGQGQRSAAWRRAGFENVKGVDDYLATLANATHMTFGHPTGPLVRGADPKEKALHAELIKSLSTAFLDAYVQDDPKAKAWLQAFFMAKHGGCATEFRPGHP